MNDDLIVEAPQGLYCPAGGFYIDPWQPVDRAVITHAHGDHARPGHAHVLASDEGAAVLRARLGAELPLQTVGYGQPVEHHGVRISLHPAGHVLGSAQVRLEHRGRVWVVSGDYFVTGHDDRNATCVPFEPVRCECFITESTFGLPIYRWRPQEALFDEINAWWRANAQAGRTSLLMGYALGKAQRVLAGVDASIGPIAVHGAVEAINAAYRASGVALPRTQHVTELDKRALAQALVVAPPSVQGSPWRRRFADASDAFASGWMQLRGTRRRRGVDRGFALSDHADWPGLQRAIAATGATRVIVTHGYEAVMVRWLAEQGLEAQSFRTAYGDETHAAADLGAAADPGADADQGAAADGPPAGGADVP